jgi:hypothetical protein
MRPTRPLRRCLGASHELQSFLERDAAEVDRLEAACCEGRLYLVGIGEVPVLAGLAHQV